jgi:hypothetical protein
MSYLVRNAVESDAVSLLDLRRTLFVQTDFMLCEERKFIDRLTSKPIAQQTILLPFSKAVALQMQSIYQTKADRISFGALSLYWQTH